VYSSILDVGTWIRDLCGSICCQNMFVIPFPLLLFYFICFFFSFNISLFTFSFYEGRIYALYSHKGKSVPLIIIIIILLFPNLIVCFIFSAVDVVRITDNKIWIIIGVLVIIETVLIILFLQQHQHQQQPFPLFSFFFFEDHFDCFDNLWRY